MGQTDRVAKAAEGDRVGTNASGRLRPALRVRRATPAPTWSLTIPAHIADRLRAYLFPGDGDEHGAVILAGMTATPAGPRLLARELVLARDGVDYVLIARQETPARDFAKLQEDLRQALKRIDLRPKEARP